MHASVRRVTRTGQRSPRLSVSPYFIEEVGLTIADVRRARGADSDGAHVAGQ